MNDSGSLYQRLRWIFWTRQHNDALLDIYKADMPMQHISTYVQSARAECGATADFASGFYQIEIPPEARPWYRFRDAAGVLWQLRKLPMGLRIAPELMSIVSETVIGSPRVCAQQHIIDGVVHDAWIDDIRVTGQTQRVDGAIAKITSRARTIGATFKEPLRAEKIYVFLGVEFNHIDASVTIAQKTRSKIPQQIPQKMTASDAEALVARLIWCSAVMLVPVACFYFVVKSVSRICNKMNRGEIGENQELALTPAVHGLLCDWRKRVMQRRFLNKPARTPFPVLFTDASDGGWGATFCDSEQRVFITGGKWTQQQRADNINLREAHALDLGVSAFADKIKTAGKGINLCIDNSSVAAATERGAARTQELNDILQRPFNWLDGNNMTVIVSWIKSENNAADGPSRGDFSITREEVTKLVERVNERGGGGARWCVR